MKPAAIVDTGPIVAFLNRRDGHHAAAAGLILRLRPPLRTCEAVVTEAAWLLRDVQGGRDALAALLARQAVVVDFSLTNEHSAVFELMRRNANVPMSFADACLVRMAEISPQLSVLTFDSDFLVYRRFGREPISTLGIAPA